MINSSEETKFQFHKGTIKTRLVFLATEPRLQFQFHKGTIKTFYVLSE